MALVKDLNKDIHCYHCGDLCFDDNINIGDKNFCCTGCKTVYQILDNSKLCNYYSIDQNPGISPKIFAAQKFDYLDEPDIIKQLVDFTNEDISAITFYIPQMHCSSCIWLLENLFKLNNGISFSQVNFLKKQLTVRFNHNKILLKELVVLISSIGYEPQIQLDSIEKKAAPYTRKKLYYKIGIAAFSFGNIMLLSFPEYLSLNLNDTLLQRTFGLLSLILALPVFFYSASDYFISAVGGLRKKIINIDFPISLGILVLFFRSSYEVLLLNRAGYFDSLTGLIFFLLIGRLFQEKTYDSLNFERTYKSYFPLAVTIKQNGVEKSVSVSKLKVGNRILIRNNEIIPADSILFSGNGNIDYSFVTGESNPVEKVMGELIYAGGRQIGGAIELEVVKEVSQSYLTQLWNNESFSKHTESNFTAFSNTVSKYFTIIILFIAVAAALLWLPVSMGTALNVFTAVLIVACPCALALSVPFTMGNATRIFGRNKLYLKNTNAVEQLARIDEIVFDKTGTITETATAKVDFVGHALNQFQSEMIRSLVRNSTHPLSRLIFKQLVGGQIFDAVDFSERHGKGIEGTVLGNKIKLGSVSFINNNNYGLSSTETLDENLSKFDTRVYLSINDKVIGYFKISNSYRKGIENVINDLGKEYGLSLLSGDNEGEKNNLLKFFKNESRMHFKQSPADKLNYIEELQRREKKILMIGDGLNDAGALSRSDVGITVTDDISSFSPACDAILDAKEIKKIPMYIRFSKTSVNIIYLSFAISFLYNLVGLSFAVDGLLSPLVAAILMPLSSISVVIFATVSTNFMARRRGL